MPENLRKCAIIELDPNLKYFIGKDLIDSTNKQVNLSGKQRFEYKSYSIGDLIYAAKTIDRGWRLVRDVDFKRNVILTSLKTEVDEYLSEQG